MLWDFKTCLNNAVRYNQVITHRIISVKQKYRVFSFHQERLLMHVNGRFAPAGKRWVELTSWGNVYNALQHL
jgi:hypothetical protein